MIVCDRCSQRIAGPCTRILLVSESDNRNCPPDLCRSCEDALLKIIEKFRRHLLDGSPVLGSNQRTPTHDPLGHF